MKPLNDAKILITTPFLNYYGGAEYMLGVVANEIFPQADLFTFSYKKNVIEEARIAESRIKTPFANGLMSTFYRELTPLYPSLVDTLNFTEYDVVLSFSYGYVHGLVSSSNQLHVSYIQTPMRLLWLADSERYWYDKVPGVKQIYQSILTWQRLWDAQAAMRPDYLIANSQEVATRINSFWRRDATVINPPVELEFYKTRAANVEKLDYFVTHSRLVKYKRIDLLIEAMILLKKNLVIIGAGPEEKRLKRLAKNSQYITFTGYVSHEEKRQWIQQSRGFVFAAHEDFGIAAVEAMACGIPVYAFGKGGALEIVTENAGRIFSEQTVESFCDNFQPFEEFCAQVDTQVIQQVAQKFTKERFVTEYGQKIEDLYEDYAKNGPAVQK